MKYKKFIKFKMNESIIMNSNDFNNFEIVEDFYCDFNIFDLFPNDSFIIILNNDICYIYTKNRKREKYSDITLIEKKFNKDFKKLSIKNTQIGETIKDQYEILSGLIIKDIIKFNQ